MHIHIKAGPAGGSVIHTRYSTSHLVKLFLVVWMFFGLIGGLATLFGPTHSADYALRYLFGVGIPMSGVLLVVVMRMIASQ